MDIYIPIAFRNRWIRFFLVDFASFLGVDTVSTTPIRNAILGFVQLAVAFGVVCLIGWAITKVFKELFG